MPGALAREPMSNRADRALIEACMRNDRRAYQRLYDILRVRLMNVCLRYASDEEEARSYFVQGFMKIANSMAGFDFNVYFETWATRVMINSILDELRKRKRYRQMIPGVDVEDVPTAAVSLNDYENKSNADDVLALVKRLPDATRDVFLLYAVDGYTHKEIAAALRVSEGTSKWHVCEARKRLKVMIAENEKKSTR